MPLSASRLWTLTWRSPSLPIVAAVATVAVPQLRPGSVLVVRDADDEDAGDPRKPPPIKSGKSTSRPMKTYGGARDMGMHEAIAKGLTTRSEFSIGQQRGGASPPNNANRAPKRQGA
ncbi:hypothetical protein B0H14DRAFT_2586594 [Mycena olivaceomarginata]|nr:hypothetical protein B0H14DRAFT_2586594 [Mycena olivaceomarginata]